MVPRLMWLLHPGEMQFPPPFSFSW